MTDPKTKRERAIEAAMRHFNVAINDTKDCPTCAGQGYHHGFGEHGHDPDWCSECGGAEFVAAFTEVQAMTAAIAEFERVMSADTVISPLADESTGGPDGGPGWEP